MAKIEVIGEIKQITRKSGSQTAKVMLEVPSDKAGKLPMGMVNVSIEASHAEHVRELNDAQT